MPTYLKVIIAVAVLAIIGAIGVVVVGVSLFKQNFGPEHAEEVAKKLVDLPKPLPEGWQYGVGLEVPRKVVNLKRKNGSALVLVQFSELPISSGQKAKDLVGRFVMPSVPGMKFELEGKGDEIIGGQKAYYIRQHCTALGRDSGVETAFVDLPSGNMIHIQTNEHGRTSYDPSLVQPLFDSIKGFVDKKAE